MQVDRLIEAHRKNLYKHALQLTRNRDDAHDLVSETTLKIVRFFDQYTHDRKFFNWALSIMYRTQIDKARRKKHRPKFLRLDFELQLENSKQIVEHEDPKALNDITDFLNLSELRLAKYELSRQQIEIMEMVIAGMTPLEIAEKMNLPGSSIRSITHRARLKIKGFLDEARKECA